jgi:hypothetical protein
MRVRVQVVIDSDDDGPPVVHEVANVERGDLHIDTLGLQLAEAKDLLQRVQAVVIGEQVRACLAEQADCPACGRARRDKDADTIVARTLFGTSLVAVLLPAAADAHLQPAGRGTARTIHTRTAVPREQVLRIGVVWTQRQTAGGNPATRPAAPRDRGPLPYPGNC